MDFRIKSFWLARKKWPPSTMGWTFLLNAVDPVGQALFPDQWKISDPITDEEIGLREEYTTIHNDQIVTYHINKGFHSARTAQKDSVARLLKLVINHGRFSEDYSEVEARWNEGVKLAEQEDIRRAAAHERYREVQQTIKTALLAGKLKSARLPKKGGSYVELRAEDWNTDRCLAARFTFGEIDPKEPIKPFVSGSGYQYIFVDEAGLTKLISSLSCDQVPTFEDSLRVENDNSARPLAAVQTSPVTGDGKQNSRVAKRRPSLERARLAVRHCFPDGPPATESRKQQYDALHAYIKAQRWNPVSEPVLLEAIQEVEVN